MAKAGPTILNPEMAGAPRKTVEAIERELAAVHEDVAHAVHAAGGLAITGRSMDRAAWERRLDAVPERLAERICLRPRPPLLDECLVLVAVVETHPPAILRGRPPICLVPALVHQENREEGYQALLRSADEIGGVIAMLMVQISTEGQALPQRVAFAGRRDRRGILGRRSHGVLRADGTAILRPWVDDDLGAAANLPSGDQLN